MHCIYNIRLKELLVCPAKSGRNIGHNDITTGPNTIHFPTFLNVQCLENLKKRYSLSTFSSLCLFNLRTGFYFVFSLKENLVVKDKSKWKCIFTHEIVFLNESLGRWLAGDKVPPD